MVKIEIDRLTEEDLVDLNHRVVARLRFLRDMRAHAEMLDFKIGDRVTFQPDDRPVMVGILTRYNKKTVTVITENGQHWNVSPGLLRKASTPERSGNAAPNVIPLRKGEAQAVCPAVGTERCAFGSSRPDGGGRWVEARNVLGRIDRLAKSGLFPEVRELYEGVCEYLHPNLGQELDPLCTE
jgi:hypothetical protein